MASGNWAGALVSGFHPLALQVGRGGPCPGGSAPGVLLGLDTIRPRSGPLTSRSWGVGLWALAGGSLASSRSLCPPAPALRPGRLGSGGVLIQPRWVQAGLGETAAGGRSEDWGPHDLLFHLGWDLLQFLLELFPGREAHHSKEVQRLLLGSSSPRVYWAHRELHFTGHGAGEGEKLESTKHAVTPR